MYDFTNRFSNPQFLAALIALLAMLLSSEVNLNTLIWAATILFGGTNQTPTEGLSDSGSNNTNPNPPATGSGGG